jgi:AcrR family transcriptional regulator
MTMRTSSRTRILDAASRLVRREGPNGLTFDAIAAEAEVTRGGVTYHFATREALVDAVHAHLAAEWDAALRQSLGADPAQASADERLTAYVRCSADTMTRGELLFMADAASEPALLAHWIDVMRRWVELAPDVHDEAALLRLEVRLAADGLWQHEAVAGEPLDEATRRRIAARLLARLTTEA